MADRSEQKLHKGTHVNALLYSWQLCYPEHKKMAISASQP